MIITANCETTEFFFKYISSCNLTFCLFCFLGGSEVDGRSFDGDHNDGTNNRQKCPSRFKVVNWRVVVYVYLLKHLSVLR